MHMIRHHNPRTELIESPVEFSDQNGFGGDVGNARIVKPSWSGGMAIQNTILRCESVPRSGVPREVWFGRQGYPQTPGDEPLRNRSGGNAVIFVGIRAYKMAGETACPTQNSVSEP